MRWLGAFLVTSAVLLYGYLSSVLGPTGARLSPFEGRLFSELVANLGTPSEMGGELATAYWKDVAARPWVVVAHIRGDPLGPSAVVESMDLIVSTGDQTYIDCRLQAETNEVGAYLISPFRCRFRSRP